MCTRDHSVEYNLQVDVKYGLSRDRQTTLKVQARYSKLAAVLLSFYIYNNSPALPRMHLQNFKIVLKKEISPRNEASRINYHKYKTITKFAVICQRSVGLSQTGWVRKNQNNNNNNNNKKNM